MFLFALGLPRLNGVFLMCHRTLNFGRRSSARLRIQYISTNQLLEDFLNSVVSQDEFEIATQNLVESLYPTTQNMDYECSVKNRCGRQTGVAGVE